MGVNPPAAGRKNLSMTSLPPQDQELVFRHLEELGDAPILSRSPRLLVLLDFLVRETLFGRGHTLKELVIGDALYSSTHPYDPGADSSVRVEVGRLRRKLDAHYAAASHRVPVRITLPKGSYRPEISVDRETRATPATGMMPRSDLAIIPFRMLGDGELGKSFASSLTDETIFSIERVARLKLAPRMIVFQLGDIPFNFADAAAFARARMLLHATVRCVGPNKPLALARGAAHLRDLGRLEKICPHALLPNGIILRGLHLIPRISTPNGCIY